VNDTYRGPGRTTRMIEAAVKCAYANNSTVTIVGRNQQQADWLLFHTLKIVNPHLVSRVKRGEIRLSETVTLKFASWETLCSRIDDTAPLDEICRRNGLPQDQTFFDHYIFEVAA
jgi:hypothetical protein